MAPKKWYAVRKGHRTGIFETWDACQAATVGFSGAQYKSFKSKEDAQAYLTGSSSGAAPAAAAAAAYTQASGRGSSAAAAGGKFYAIARGRQVGIFDSWQQAKAMVEGYTNPVYKGFTSRQAAEDFLAQHSSSGSSSGSGRAYGTVRGAGEDEPAGAAAKRQRGDSYQAPAPPPAFSGQQQQQQQQQGAQAVNPGLLLQHPIVTITFDGGSRSNPGRAGYGYAVFERQRNERLRMGCRPLVYGSTNNEAEYSGLIAGMRYALEKLGARHIVARGDSQLVVRQMTGEYKVNGERLKPLHREAKMLEQRCESFQIEHIYREENSLADLLSNLAMDSDAAVDKIVQLWTQQGLGREQLAALLAAGAQVDGQVSQVNALRTAPCFMLAAAQLLAQLWDGMPVEEVAANLAARGWDEGTGGAPVDPLPLGADSAGADSASRANSATAAGAGAGTSGAVAAAVAAMSGGSRGSRGRGVGHNSSNSSSRGMHVVPVAPVALGQGWAQEVGRQEALMQQQQQQQQQGGVGSAGGGSGAAAGAAAGVVPRLLLNSPVCYTAAASVAAARTVRAETTVLLQLQRCRQHRALPSGNATAASMMCLGRGQADIAKSGRLHGLQRQLQQQHQFLSRIAPHSTSLLIRSSSSSSLRVRAGRVLAAAAAATAGRLSRREAGAGRSSSSSSDSSRQGRGVRVLTV